MAVKRGERDSDARFLPRVSRSWAPLSQPECVCAWTMHSSEVMWNPSLQKLLVGHLPGSPVPFQRLPDILIISTSIAKSCSNSLGIVSLWAANVSPCHLFFLQKVGTIQVFVCAAKLLGPSRDHQESLEQGKCTASGVQALCFASVIAVLRRSMDWWHLSILPQTWGAAQHGSALGITGKIKLKTFIVSTGCLWKLSPCSAEEQEQWQALSKVMLCQAAQKTAPWPNWLLYFHVCLKEGLGGKTCRCYSFSVCFDSALWGQPVGRHSTFRSGASTDSDLDIAKKLFLLRSRWFYLSYNIKNTKFHRAHLCRTLTVPCSTSSWGELKISEDLGHNSLKSLCSPLPLKMI